MVTQRIARAERSLRVARLHRQKRQVLEVAGAQTNAAATTSATVEDGGDVLDGRLVVETGVDGTVGSGGKVEKLFGVVAVAVKHGGRHGEGG